MFACAPECGCTLACSAPNSAFARSMASALDDVDELAAAVVALARIALGVLVGQHRAGRFEHRAADEVLRGDQLEAVVLAMQLVADRAGDLGIGLGERAPAWRGSWSWWPSSAQPAQSTARSMLLRVRDLIDPPLVASALERASPARASRISSARPNATMRPPIERTLASLCCARQARGVEIVAQRGADAGDLVGGDLLALAAAAEHDAAVGAPVGDRAADRDADRRIVDRRFAVGAVIVDLVAQADEGRHEMLFQREPRVICADGDAHNGEIIPGVARLRARNPGCGSVAPREADRPRKPTGPGTTLTTVTISPRGEERLLNGHPWIYRSDVAKAEAGAARPSRSDRRADARSATRSIAIDPRSRSAC